MFYGLTHQGLRFSLFWVFLALVLAVGCRRRERPAPAATQPATTAALAPPWPSPARAGARR